MKPPVHNPTRTVAVIDVGTTSIRLQIADVGESGIHVLEVLSQSVSLGKDTFATGEIGRATMEECVNVLRDYRSKLDEYQIPFDNVRVVATSAVREATNRLAFIDRIFIATGLSVEPIDVAEVHRVTYRGIQPLLKERPSLFEAVSAIVEVSGGSTDLLMLDQGNVSFTHSFKIGTLRLQQMLESSQVPYSRRRQVLEAEVNSLLEPLAERLPQGRRINLVTMGSDGRFAAHELVGHEPVAGSLTELRVSDLAKFTDRIFDMTEEELVDEFQLSFTEAETIGPALLTYLRLADMMGCESLLVSASNLREGLIRELGGGRRNTDDFQQQIIRSAWELAGRYHVDEDHARHVAKLCGRLFRLLRTEHQLESRYETVLTVAAILHEAGGYINSSGLHKHSQYIILNSEIFGLTTDETLLAGLVTRYHRRSFPKPTHQPYATLDREKRVVVCKLAAILRIALALDAARSQRIADFNVERVRGRLILTVPDVDDLSIEQLALPSARSFFESIFGLKIVLRTQTRISSVEASSQL